MTTRSVLTLVCLVLSLGLAVRAEQSWQAFAPSDKSFSVSMPGAAQQTQNGPKSWMWTASTPAKQAYIVSYAPVEGINKLSTTERTAALDVFTRELLRSANITEKSRNVIPFGCDIGGDMATKAGITLPVQLRISMHAADNRIYTLMTIGDGCETTRFFDSFKTN